jgi:hypothetical protein
MRYHNTLNPCQHIHQGLLHQTTCHQRTAKNPDFSFPIWFPSRGERPFRNRETHVTIQGLCFYNTGPTIGFFLAGTLGGRTRGEVPRYGEISFYGRKSFFLMPLLGQTSSLQVHCINARIYCLHWFVIAIMFFFL